MNQFYRWSQYCNCSDLSVYNYTFILTIPLSIDETYSFYMVFINFKLLLVISHFHSTWIVWDTPFHVIPTFALLSRSLCPLCNLNCFSYRQIQLSIAPLTQLLCNIPWIESVKFHGIVSVWIEFASKIQLHKLYIWS